MNWKVFIVFHDKVYPELYTDDKLFSVDNYTFFKVGNTQITIDQPYLDIKNLNIYKKLGKHYAESEAIYNIYKNPYLWENLDYIGFTQYDKPHILKKTLESNVTEQILLNLSSENHVSFENHPFWWDFGQHIMMDQNWPDQLVGNGINCYDVIIGDYKCYHHLTKDLEIREKVNLCSSFLLPIKNFKNVMEFISWVIESGKLNKFDTERKYRMQGGLLERYFAIAIMMENLENIDLSTEHYDLK